jgi:hypothetical protein
MNGEQARVLKEMQRNPDSPHTANTLRAKLTTMDALAAEGIVTADLAGFNGDRSSFREGLLWRLTDKGKGVEVDA